MTKPTKRLPSMHWEDVKSSAQAGVPMVELAERYGVSADAIRQRARRENWATPQRVLKKAAELSSRPVTLDTDPVTLAAECLVNAGNAATSHAIRVLLGKLAKAALNPHSIQDLRNVSDVVTAMKGARIAAGLQGDDGVSVALNLGMFGTQSQLDDVTWELDSLSNDEATRSP